MFRSWSANNLNLYYIEQDTVTLTGATSYTIGSGGVVDTVRPAAIKGGTVSSGSIERVLKIIDEARYRSLSNKSLSGVPEYLWYNPEYPLGLLYFYPLASGTAKIDSLNPLLEPTAIGANVIFPPEYDEAIKWNLAVRLAPEFRTSVPVEVAALARATLDALQNRNFAEQINESRLDILKVSYGRYNIDWDG